MAFAATNAVEHAGAASILVDCDSAIELIDLDAPESVSPRTNAIMPAHLNVRPIDMDRMHQLRDPLGIAVLEDAAHANAARSRRQRTGSHHHLATYSSYVTTNATTTQGGALVMRQSRPWYTIHVTDDAPLRADDLLSRRQQQLIGIEVHYRGLHLPPNSRTRYDLDPACLPESIAISNISNRAKRDARPEAHRLRSSRRSQRAAECLGCTVPTDAFDAGHPMSQGWGGLQGLFRRPRIRRVSSPARRALNRWRDYRRRAPTHRSSIEYWSARADELGAAAVFNRGHSPARHAEITAHQKDVLYPCLRAELAGWERDVLDFGCGTGRFTRDLAALVSGQAIGVDPISALLDLAPRHSSVDYKTMTPGRVPADTGSIDVVWVCLVLGGITDADDLRQTASELERVLQQDGLLFLVENVANRPSSSTWVYRTVAEYSSLFRSVALRQVGEYVDLGERIAVLAGRRS